MGGLNAKSSEKKSREETTVLAPEAANPSHPRSRYDEVLALQHTVGNRTVDALLHANLPETVEAILRRRVGWPLDPETRADMESRFSADFSHVRIHTGPRAAGAARSVAAQAFTIGRDVVFGENRFDPQSAGGRHLLVHELAHVVQQTRQEPRAISATGGQAEADARAAAEAYAGARPLLPVAVSSPVVIACASEKSFAEEEEDEFRRHAAEDKAERRGQKRRRGWRGSKQAPPTGAAVTRDAAQQIQRMIQDAEKGAYRHVNIRNRQRATNKLRRLLDNYRASEMQRIDFQLATTPSGERREALVKQKKVIVLERNGFKKDFDEAMRRPARAEPQPKYVRGGAARSYHETRPGVGQYANPDYSEFSFRVKREIGGATWCHVNLKAHDMRDLTPAEARAIAREVTAQATKNLLGDPSRRGDVGHLPTGDRLIISFIDQPDRLIKAEMNKIMLNKNSPITEVRFGHATHRKGGSSKGGPTPAIPAVAPQPQSKALAKAAPVTPHTPKKGPTTAATPATTALPQPSSKAPAKAAPVHAASKPSAAPAAPASKPSTVAAPPVTKPPAPPATPKPLAAAPSVTKLPALGTPAPPAVVPPVSKLPPAPVTAEAAAPAVPAGPTAPVLAPQTTKVELPVPVGKPPAEPGAALPAKTMEVPPSPKQIPIRLKSGTLPPGGKWGSLATLGKGVGTSAAGLVLGFALGWLQEKGVSRNREEQISALEPEIATKMKEMHGEVAELQARYPEKSLFYVVKITWLSRIEWLIDLSGPQFTPPMDYGFELSSVTISDRAIEEPIYEEDMLKVKGIGEFLVHHFSSHTKEISLTYSAPIKPVYEEGQKW